MRLKVDVRGARTVEQALVRIPQLIQRRTLDPIVKRGAEMVVEVMRQEAPIGPPGRRYKGTPITPGGLRRQIRAIRSTDISRRSASRVVWLARSTARHSYLVEFGNTLTRPRRTKGGASRGNMPPNRFGKRSRRKARPSVEAYMRRAIPYAIERTVRRVRRRGARP